MQNFYAKLTVFLFFFLLSFGFISAQDKLWPGDANNSGVTNCVDLLYIGVGYNENGPSRPNATTLWQEQDINTLWPEYYLDNTTNYAYGDCNGDGVINDNDVNMAIKANYYLQHTSNNIIVDADGFEPSSATSPILEINPDVTTVSEGDEVKIELNLGDANLPIDDFYGVAMVVSYDRPYIDMSAPVQFVRELNSFADPLNSDAINTVFTDTLNRQFDFAFVRTTRQNAASGHGTLGTFSFIIDDDVIAPLIIDTVTIKVDSVRLIDKDLNSIPVNFESASFKVEILQSARSGSSTNCPNVLDPVCGVNGVTYMNSCFAKAAGVTEFTSGICYSECVDPNDIDINGLADCSNSYIPVCGCNDVTYLNSCVAENSGITEFTIGACAQTVSCFDPSILSSSAGATIDSDTGVIEEDCDDTYSPVCGCDGFTYQNSCLAEASGIAFYTQGPCNSICVDPNAMNPYPNCVNLYEPVCGCNDVTYTNACFAEAAGVVDYYSGTCGSSPNQNTWCTGAQAIQCGDYLASETTVGAGNDIETYYWNTNVTYTGADKVYVINKDQAGDLQIGLEIITPGINLDLFLLSGDCDNLTCIAASQNSNAGTNNEGIVFENAPIGTYYIVVDGLIPSFQGDFKLEVSCGDLDCSNAQALQCGLPFSFNNSHGDDNVSAYGCGSTLNVENNGNEVVHTFALTEAGQVDIYLTNLNANLELFLLSECDRGDCAEFSSHPGNSDEHISTYLQAGVYYVVVDGYNGAASNYQLLVDCPSTCDLDVTGTTTGTNCGQNNGSFTVNSTGGTPGFIVAWTGPISGSFSTYANTCTIYNLPAGTYHVTKTDANGCSDHVTLVINDFGSQLTASYNVTNAVCNTKGSVHVSLSNGTAPYHINISGPTSGTAISVSSSFNINQLPAGVYTIYITDKHGCTISKTFTILQDNNNFTISGYTTASQCESLGKIHISLANGKPTYTIHVSGPVSGSATTTSSSFNIPNLPGGTYTVLIEDGNWCSDEMIFVIEDKDIDISLTPSNGICGDNGSLTINISSGTPNYSITWSGPSSGNVISAAPSFTIPGLPSGTYSVTVMDANWCQDYQVVTIDNTIANLDVSVTTTDGVCGVGSIWLDINNGTGPYTVTYSGPDSGSGTTTTNGFDVSNLTAGTYTITVVDTNNCTYTEVVEVGSDDTNINVAAWPNDGICGDLGNIEVTVTNGTAPYTISYGGPATNTVSSTSPIFIIDDLISGTYDIEVTDENGCMDWTTAYLNNSGSGMVITTAPWNGTCGTPGEITIDIDGGTPDYDISWDGPTSGAATSSSSSYTINNALSGTYGVTVTDSQGCTDTSNQVIDNNSNNLAIVLDITNGQCGNSGGVNIMISGASAPYQVSWTGEQNGSGTTSSDFGINNLTAGHYTITVESADGCIKSTQIEIVNEGTPPVVTVSSAASVCGSGGAINIIYDAPQVTITYTGPISGTMTSTNGVFVIDNAPEGWYDIVVSAGNGCDVQVGAEIIEIVNDFDFNISATDAECQSKGSASISFGSGSYDIVWSGPSSGNVVDNSGVYTIQNLPAGDYTVSLIDSDGCKKTKTFTIDLNQTVVNVTATPTNGVCNTKGSIEVVFSGGSGTVSWSGPSSGSSTSSTGGFNILNLESGTYTITVEATNGCTGSTTTEIINANEDVPFTITQTDAICNSNGSISISTGSDITSIYYTGPISGTSSPSNGTVNISNAPAGTYSITATNMNGCTTVQTADVNSTTTTLNLVADPADGLCNQNGSVKLTFVSGDITVAWTGPINGSSMSSNGALEIQNLVSGNYSITITDINGCKETTTFTISNTASSIGISPNITNADCCESGSVNLSVSGSTGALTYIWMPNVSNSGTANDLDAGMYTVTVTDENGCSANTSFVVQNNCACPDLVEADTLFFAGAPSVELCVPIPFLDRNLYDIILNDLDYVLPLKACDLDTLIQYSYVVLFGLGQDGPYQINEWQANGQTFSGLVQNMDDLTDSLNVWDPTGNWVHQPAQFSIVGGDSAGAYGSIKATHISSGVQSEMNINFTSLAAGFTVEVENIKPVQELIIIDTATCCSDTVIIVFDGGCDFSLTESHTDVECNKFGSVNLSFVNGTAPYSIAQSGTTSNSYSSNNNSLTIADLAVGSYTFLVNDANSCAQSIDVTIGETSSNLLISANATSDVCGSNGMVALTLMGGTADYTIVISGPTSSSQTITGTSLSLDGLSSGSYTASVSDVNGCTSSSSFIINNVNNNISIVATAVNGSCGQTPGFSMNILGGTPAYTISWNGPENGTTTTNNTMVNVNDLTPGTYSISVVDSNGCSQTTSVTISNSAGNFDAIIAVTDAYCGVLGSIWITVNSGIPPYLVTWTGVQSGTYSSSNVVNDISNLPAGTYTASITDANGCSKSATVTINDNGVPTAFNGTVSNPTNTNDGAILVEVTTSNPFHTITWNGPVSGTVTVGGQFFNITSLPEGNYGVTVEDKDGCTSTQNFILTNSGTGTGTGTGSGGNEFSANVNPTDMTCGEFGNLFIAFNNGTAPYSITWSGAASGTDNTSNSIYSIANLGMGNYTVVVTDADGNTSTANVSIGGSDAFDITTSTNNGSCGNDDGSVSIVVNSGTPNYTIFWSGPVSNNAVFTNQAITINDLPSGLYDITVSDANDCAQILSTEINNTSGEPVANFSSVNNALTSSFTNNASAGLYTWDFGDGNTSNETNPMHEFCDQGTYTVCLTVINTCGSNMVCSDVTVSIPTDIVVLDIQNGSGGLGSTVSVPVTITNCETIVSLAGSLAVQDNSVCTITGISPGIISPNYFSANSSFSYINNNGSGVITSDNDILFYIDVQLTGNANEATTLYITDNPLLVEVGSIVNNLATVLPSIELKGTVSISSSARISGQVKTYWGEGIKNTQITVQSANMQNIQTTDDDGYYMEPDLPMGEMYDVIPERDFNDQNGLSSYALFVGQRFILGMDPIEFVSPYQVIAGDANCSNSFTTIDLFILQQLIIGTSDGLDFCPSWTFVKENDQMPTDFDAYNVFPYNNDDQIMVMSDEVSNFVGVKVGDILGHANPNNLTENDDDLTKSFGKLDLFVNKVDVVAGESFDLSFTGANFEDIVSYQLGIGFDQGKLAFENHIKSSHEVLAGTAIGENDAEEGMLRASWFSLDGEGLSVDSDTELFTLRFTALTDMDNILDYINFENKPILTEAHNVNLQKLDVTLDVEQEALTSTENELLSQFSLSQNTPNPFYETTDIAFTLPQSMNAVLSITNTLGETVKTIQKDFNQGLNVVTLRQIELGSGVFQYTITAKGKSITKSMISLK